MHLPATLPWRRRWNRIVECRWRIAVLTMLGAALLATVFVAPRPQLVWNASASSPIGLYAVSIPTRVTAGDMVVAWLPPSMRRLAAERRYLPGNVPVIKTVAAITGDRVCAIGDVILVNRRPVGRRQHADPIGRPLPRWTGCRRLGDGDLLLLSVRSPLSFDGRYVGVTRAEFVVGRARLLWRRS